jgi:hypothetical protein
MRTTTTTATTTNACATVLTMLDDLEHADSKIRLQALRELCPCHVRRNVPEIWDRVLRLVQDENVRVRSAVLHMLADGSPLERCDEVVWAIGILVHDPDLTLRRRARGVLAAYRSTGRVNVL